MVRIKLTNNNLDDFIASLRNRLAEELKLEVPVAIESRDHYAEQRLIEIEGTLFPTPAIGETIYIQIGYTSNLIKVNAKRE